MGACGDRDPSPTGLTPAPEVEPVLRPAEVRGIHVGAQAAGSPSELAGLLELAEHSVVNTFVIDVKARGEVSWESSVAVAAEIGANRSHLADVDDLLRTLRDRRIYPVARIAVFRDPVLAEARPEWAIRTRDGRVWIDPESGRPWADPYNEDVWAYNIDLAREALARGFAEIQWDYVRFPDVTGPSRASMVFPAARGRRLTQAIEGFVELSRRELPAPVAVNVFGRVINEAPDTDIGQDWTGLARVSDVIQPMVYPALYTPGYYGLDDPNAEPYRLVRIAMDRAVARNARSGGSVASIRPWLQAFSLGSASYGADEIRAQIQAVEDAGLDEWLLWHPESEYPAEAFAGRRPSTSAGATAR
jgi:hypothetical protein